MRILKVISLLLDYPTETLVNGRDELEQAILESREISPKQRGALFELLELICANDLMDGQEHYGALLAGGVRCRCCCSNTFTASPATAARPWST